MILTHFLTLIAVPQSAVTPAAAVLAVSSTQMLVGNGRLSPDLVPAMTVRAGSPVLAIRER